MSVNTSEAPPMVPVPMLDLKLANYVEEVELAWARESAWPDATGYGLQLELALAIANWEYALVNSTQMPPAVAGQRIGEAMVPVACWSSLAGQWLASVLQNQQPEHPLHRRLAQLIGWTDHVTQALATKGADLTQAAEFIGQLEYSVDLFDLAFTSLRLRGFTGGNLVSSQR